MGMVSDSGTKTSKLSKLTQMEAMVTKLSEQLAASKKTILMLKQKLTERDLKIHELESKLAYAEQSLLDKAIHNIHQCRSQILIGLDEKIINPTLAQIEQQIEVIHGIVYEAKDLISKKNNLNCENIRSGRDIVEHEIIYPGKVWYDKIVVFTRALPTQSKVLFQVWVEEPVMHKIETLPDLGKGLGANAEVLLKGLVGQLKSGAEQGMENAIDAIKKSQFWDGKRKTGVA
jgi:hypothetical protein